MGPDFIENNNMLSFLHLKIHELKNQMVHMKPHTI